MMTLDMCHVSLSQHTVLLLQQHLNQCETASITIVLSRDKVRVCLGGELLAQCMGTSIWRSQPDVLEALKPHPRIILDKAKRPNEINHTSR